MKKIILTILVICLLGCSQQIVDIRDEEHIGKTVTVSGTVENTIKIGQLSGFTLNDGENKIGISSDTLPKEGEKVTVKGVLIKDTLFGYYIKAEKVN